MKENSPNGYLIINESEAKQNSKSKKIYFSNVFSKVEKSDRNKGYYKLKRDLSLLEKDVKLLEDYANKDKSFYSHIEESDYNNNSLFTAFKMQAAYKCNDIKILTERLLNKYIERFEDIANKDKKKKCKARIMTLLNNDYQINRINQRKKISVLFRKKLNNNRYSIFKMNTDDNININNNNVNNNVSKNIKAQNKANKNGAFNPTIPKAISLVNIYPLKQR